MKRSVRILLWLQLLVSGLALWNLYDIQASSQSLKYTGRGLLLPCGLCCLHALSLAIPKLNLAADCRASALKLGLTLPIASVIAWWLLLFVADLSGWVGEGARGSAPSLNWFFVRSGSLPSNEIFGSAIGLFVIVVLQSFAALLGVVPLLMIWFDERRMCVTSAAGSTSSHS